MPLCKQVLRILLALGTAPILYSNAIAQVQLVEQPPEANLDEPAQPTEADGAWKDASGTAAPAVQNDDPETFVELDILLRKSRIWNPNTRVFDNVELRAYQRTDGGLPPESPYIAPRVEARPGQTVRLKFRNRLPAEPECQHTKETFNAPNDKKCFNTTNNHFHGGFVSPAGISDNVLRELPPNPDYAYEYNIPSDHPAGTFWYHPHVHGSTAIQVGSGMAGALIVTGDRIPKPAPAPGGGIVPGDIDILLKQNGKPLDDKVFMLQQIQYACKTRADGSAKPEDDIWDCASDEIGKLDSYDLLVGKNGPLWAKSKRFTTVNGAVAAPLGEKMIAGQPERWRFIHGGFGDSINLQIFRKKNKDVLSSGKPTEFETVGADDQQRAIDRECDVTGDAVPLFEIAADGLTRDRVTEYTNRILHPGYRSDLLVAITEPGSYCVVDMALSKNSGIPGTLDTARLLFTVTVDPSTSQSGGPDPKALIRNLLLSAANTVSGLDGGVKRTIVQDLMNDLRLASFAPHRTLTNRPVDNRYFTAFSFGALDPETKKPGPGMVTTKDTPPTVVTRYSDAESAVLKLVLDDVDEWQLQTVSASDGSHPFHIHVNPFEIVSVKKKSNPDVDLTADPSSQYYGMKGVWRDTVFVENDALVTFRTTYRRYIGDFVTHCHILYHEDGGMMQRVRIVDRDARGNAVIASHKEH